MRFFDAPVSVILEEFLILSRGGAVGADRTFSIPRAATSAKSLKSED